MKFTYYYVFLLFIGTSCSNAINNKIIFPTNNFNYIKGKQILPDLFIGNPLNMLLINNNLLLIDIYEDHQMTLIDTNDKNKVERIAKRGEGPNEFINIRNITYNSIDNSVCLFDGMTRSCSFYKMNNNSIKLDKNNFLKRIHFNENYPYDIIPFNNKFLSNGCFDQKQFALFDDNENSILNFGIYPGDKNGIEIGNCFFLKNQTIITTSPDQEYFAAAGVFHDQLVFYKNEKNGKLTKIKEYFSIDSKMNTNQIKDGETTQYSSSETPETTRTYRVLYPTNSFLYALYWGIQNKDINNNNICYILKFDWNGNLKAGFKIAQRLNTFAIDENRNCICGIAYPEDEECILLQYDM